MFNYSSPSTNLPPNQAPNHKFPCKLNYPLKRLLIFLYSSPYFALVHRIHPRAQFALEVRRELARVGEGSLDAEHSRRVGARLDALLKRLGAVLGAPRVGCRQPKQLILVHREARQQLLRALPLDETLCEEINEMDMKSTCKSVPFVGSGTHGKPCRPP